MSDTLLRGARALLICLASTFFLVAFADAGHAESGSSPAWGRWNPADIVAAPRIELDTTLRRIVPAESLSRTQWKVCDPCKRGRRWDLKLGPYGWLAGVSGTAYEDGRSQDFEISFDDLKELISGGFMLYATFAIDRWFISFDGTWATLQKEFPWALGTFGFKIEQTIIELRAGYRLLGPAHGQRCDCRASCCPPPGRDRFALDAYLGARYWKSDSTLRIGVGPADFEGSTSDEWVDPLVGVRLGYQLAPKWTVGGRIDVGGFGIGKASSFTYRSFLGIDWQFARRWSLTFGYQVIGLDRVTGSGTNRDGTNITQQGPLFGLLWNL